MDDTVAKQVKDILVSSGHNTRKSAFKGVFPVSDAVKQAHLYDKETGTPIPFSHVMAAGEHFTSEPDGEEAVVNYWGSVHREEERLRLYRLAVENCSFVVTEEDDPERKGRKRLRVARP